MTNKVEYIKTLAVDILPTAARREVTPTSLWFSRRKISRIKAGCPVSHIVRPATAGPIGARTT